MKYAILIIENQDIDTVLTLLNKFTLLKKMRTTPSIIRISNRIRANFCPSWSEILVRTMNLKKENT